MAKRAGTSAAAVLEAPEAGYAPVAEAGWRGPVPAPAGSLHRGLKADADEAASYSGDSDDDYTPRRGKFQPTLRNLLRSKGGRIVVGVLGLVVAGGVLVAAAAVQQYLLHDPRFVVASSDDIQISGNAHLTREQLLGVFGGDLERNVFRVPLDERQADLQRLPWVEHATVMRLLPNQLKVQIVERVPVAFARQGTQIGLVDAHGVLLDMSPNAQADAKYSFPVLTGINAGDLDSMREARMAIYQHFMRDLDSDGKGYSKSVSEVDITEPDDLKALIATGGGGEVLVHFGDEKFLSRYEQFEKYLPEWKQQYPKLAAADMRYEGQIVLEMQKDVEAAGADPKASAGSAPVSEAKAAAPERVAAPSRVRESGPGAPTVVAAKPVVKAAAPAKMVEVSAPVVKAPAKSVPRPAVAKRPAAKKVVAKKKAAARRTDGRDAANDKVFAELAAERKAKAKH